MNQEVRLAVRRGLYLSDAPLDEEKVLAQGTLEHGAEQLHLRHNLVVAIVIAQPAALAHQLLNFAQGRAVVLGKFAQIEAGRLQADVALHILVKGLSGISLRCDPQALGHKKVGSNLVAGFLVGVQFVIQLDFKLVLIVMLPTAEWSQAWSVL